MAMLPPSHTASGSRVGCRQIFSLPSDLLVCIEALALYRLKYGVTAAFEGTLGLLVEALRRPYRCPARHDLDLPRPGQCLQRVVYLPKDPVRKDAPDLRQGHVDPHATVFLHFHAVDQPEVEYGEVVPPGDHARVFDRAERLVDGFDRREVLTRVAHAVTSCPRKVDQGSRRPLPFLFCANSSSSSLRLRSSTSIPCRRAKLSARIFCRISSVSCPAGWSSGKSKFRNAS